MLTRRSRKDADASSNDGTPKNYNSSPKKLASPKKTNKSTTRPRSLSKSVDRNITTRSKSINRSSTTLLNPYVLLKKYEPEVKEKKKTLKSNY